MEGRSIYSKASSKTPVRSTSTKSTCRTTGLTPTLSESTRILVTTDFRSVYNERWSKAWGSYWAWKADGDYQRVGAATVEGAHNIIEWCGGCAEFVGVGTNVDTGEACLVYKIDQKAKAERDLYDFYGNN